ncbi:MAG: hypothetical protein NT166_26340 [Candidatus Aminicenantes bacterium]|nr:hypothetical protein [Candidatus Aminicenantes bacterium]
MRNRYFLYVLALVSIIFLEFHTQAFSETPLAKEPLPITVDKIAEIRMDTALTLLEEPRPGTIFIFVRNISTAPITVASIKSIFTDDFISLQIPELGKGRVLMPQESLSVPIIVKANDAVKPGQYLLPFEVCLDLQHYGFSHMVNQIVTHKINVGLLAESDILKLLGVPSFFLLPGFLMLTTFLWLWAHLWVMKEQKNFDIKVTEPIFWVIAILFSLINVPLYSKITGLFGNPRNYLIAYGLKDIAYVWGGSIAIGVIACLLGKAITERKKKKRIPSEKDQPVDILHKLARNRLGFKLKQYEIKIGDQPQKFFIIEVLNGEKIELWAIRTIIYAWEKQIIPTKDYQTRFTDQLKNADDAEAMATIIQEGLDKKLLRVFWEELMTPRKLEQKPDSMNTLKEYCLIRYKGIK